jgi:hypothetical protein
VCHCRRYKNLLLQIAVPFVCLCSAASPIFITDFSRLLNSLIFAFLCHCVQFGASFGNSWWKDTHYVHLTFSDESSIWTCSGLCFKLFAYHFACFLAFCC